MGGVPNDFRARSQAETPCPFEARERQRSSAVRYRARIRRSDRASLTKSGLQF